MHYKENINYMDMKAKGILIVMAGAALLFGTACEEMGDMFSDYGVKTTSDYYSIELAIPPAPAGVQVYVHTLMQSDIESMLSAYSESEVTVNKIEVLDAFIEVMEESNIPNLNAVESITTSISTSMLEEQIIASCTNTLSDADRLPMEVEPVDIAGYMGASEYYLTNYGMLREATTDTLWIRGQIRYQLSLTVKNVEN